MKNIIITGASSGFGTLAARALAIRDRWGSHLLLRFVERTSEGEEDE